MVPDHRQGVAPDVRAHANAVDLKLGPPVRCEPRITPSPAHRERHGVVGVHEAEAEPRVRDIHQQGGYEEAADGQKALAPGDRYSAEPPRTQPETESGSNGCLYGEGRP